MATDDAPRKWRTEDVHPLIDGITHRITLYQLLATQRFGAKLLPNAREESERFVVELAATPDWNIYAAPLRHVASDKMSVALTQLYAAENEAHGLLVRELDERLPTDDDVPQLNHVGERYSAARAAIRAAAESYIFRTM